MLNNEDMARLCYEAAALRLNFSGWPNEVKPWEDVKDWFLKVSTLACAGVNSPITLWEAYKITNGCSVQHMPYCKLKESTRISLESIFCIIQGYLSMKRNKLLEMNKMEASELCRREDGCNVNTKKDVIEPQKSKSET